MNTVSVGWWVARRIVMRARLMGIDLSGYYGSGFVFDSRFDTDTHCWVGAPIGEVSTDWTWDKLVQGEKSQMEEWSDQHIGKLEMRGQLQFRLVDDDVHFIMKRVGKLSGPVKGLVLGCP